MYTYQYRSVSKIVLFYKLKHIIEFKLIGLREKGNLCYAQGDSERALQVCKWVSLTNAVLMVLTLLVCQYSMLVYTVQ